MRGGWLILKPVLEAGFLFILGLYCWGVVDCGFPSFLLFLLAMQSGMHIFSCMSYAQLLSTCRYTTKLWMSQATVVCMLNSA